MRTELQTLTKAVIFLLNDWIKNAHYKFQSYLSSAETLADEKGISAGLLEEAEKLETRLHEAEALMEQLRN